MKSKTKIDRQARRKTNPEIVRTIIKAKKLEGWLELANILSRPRSSKISVNLDNIEEKSEEGDTIIIPGKVLGSGEISKRIRIAALGFSEQAEEKLREKKCELVSIEEEIEKNPKAEGVKIVS